ncbi:MAG: TlpA family protein disulfide reductase [candidate division KSB1 bacterium]|nr:TlpA family protein disulfide reductase [candidate division KSB1 bacterium]MDZ7357728.1 TlpA family protein disulfide reductase [candidate division KSB1 bacterium]MDZ7376780.1 TlpA family protein disulfide reductase [candidate division KSB1 bacterium]MDZ7402030.1 TlpA family protein disulfide reductase [candidate division KSB1 bacterium]
MIDFTTSIKHLLLLIFFLINTTLMAQEKKLQIGDQAPAFVLKSIEDEYVYLRDYCGELRAPIKDKRQHVVIISFFATWCEPCHKEIEELTEVLGEFENQPIKVLLIDLKEEKSTVESFLKGRNYPGIILLDKYGVAAKSYGVTTIPRSFVVNRDGKLVWQAEGYQQDFRQQIRSVLNKLFP